MKETRDPWYVRLPDGRTFKAKSTSAVKHHIEAGTIPLNSHVRRDPEGEWISLAWTPEFATQTVGGTNRSPASLAEMSLPSLPSRDSAEEPPKSGVSSRLDPLKLQTVGIRGFVEELYAAFDSSVQTSKLLVACVVGAGLLAGSFLLSFLFTELKLPTLLAELLTLAWSLGALAVSFTIIGRQTHLELTRMSPASFRDGLQGFIPSLIQVGICFAILGGIGYGVIWGLGLALKELGTTALIVSLIYTVALPVLMGLFLFGILMFLLAPIVIVEGCSFVEAFREWRALLREHRMRVALYSGLALVLGVIATVPLMLPYQLAMHEMQALGLTGKESLIIGVVSGAMKGFAIGPCLAFLAVANVFIYLNLRYEYTPNK